MIHDTHDTAKNDIVSLFDVFFRGIHDFFTYVVNGSESVWELHDDIDILCDDIEKMEESL